MGVDDFVFNLFINEIEMTHIALSEICDEMLKKNNGIAEDICTTVKNVLSPIIDKVDSAEKWDEAINKLLQR